MRALRGQAPEIDVVRVQDAGLQGASDPEVLAWAADENRLVLTHDVTTMTRFALERVRAGQRMPGLIEVPTRLPIGRAVDDVLILATASRPREWEGQVLYLPL